LIDPAPEFAVTPAARLIAGSVAKLLKSIDPPEVTVTRPVNVFAAALLEYVSAPETVVVPDIVIATAPRVVVPLTTLRLPAQVIAEAIEDVPVVLSSVFAFIFVRLA
jgi:hypothetical protein